ncbi:MAG: hypothetical protein ACXWL2_02000 [Candidatus Chromulinivorax sp.]
MLIPISYTIIMLFCLDPLQIQASVSSKPKITTSFIKDPIDISASYELNLKNTGPVKMQPEFFENEAKKPVEVGKKKDIKKETTISVLPTQENTITFQKPSIITLAQELPKKISGSTSSLINKIMFKFLKHSLRLPLATKFSLQQTVSENLAEIVKDAIFNLSNLSESIPGSKQISLNQFKAEMEFIAEQIEKLSKTTVYTNLILQQMLQLIFCINQFLFDSNNIALTYHEVETINKVSKTANNCLNICLHKNLIFSNYNLPKNIETFFAKPISTIEQLSDTELSNLTIQEIYTPNGTMDQLITTWNTFNSNQAQTIINKQYAAFITLLLLFENSVIAAATILNQTSALYKVINPITIDFTFPSIDQNYGR